MLSISKSFISFPFIVSVFQVGKVNQVPVTLVLAGSESSLSYSPPPHIHIYYCILYLSSTKCFANYFGILCSLLGCKVKLAYTYYSLQETKVLLNSLISNYFSLPTHFEPGGDGD